MGFYICSLDEPETLQEYIGSQTMYSIADNGGFDCVVSDYWHDYAEKTDGVMALVDEEGVDSFLNVLKSGICHGRDIEKIIIWVENKYKKGFLIKG